MGAYYLIDASNAILNSVIAGSPDSALLGAADGTQALTELGPEHYYPASPTKPNEPLSKLAFLRMFTASERIAIRASADPFVIDFMLLLDLAQEVRIDDEDTQAGLGYLYQQGFLTGERAASIGWRGA